MLRKIENCPLVAITRNGNIILFNHNVIVKGTATSDLTVESVVEISLELYKNGIDIITVSIDKNRMHCIEMEVL